MKPEEIRDYWDEKARTLRTDPSATMRDVILRGMEIEAIGRRLREEDDLLDVGAGNAFGSLAWAELCRSVLATDFSEEMVASARDAITESGKENITAEVADVLDLGRLAGRFSAVSIVRCLINLTEQDQQYAAVDQLASTLRPGGRLLLIEGFEETFNAMNAMREANGLEPIKLHWHNRILRRATFEAKLAEQFTIEEVVDFGEYYYLSRVVHPLLVAPDEPQFEAKINRLARQLWRNGSAAGRFADISTLLLYVARKK